MHLLSKILLLISFLKVANDAHIDPGSGYHCLMEDWPSSTTAYDGYRKEKAYCIYGISYTFDGKNFTFNDDLYYNDEMNWRKGDMEIKEFINAATPLCDKVRQINEVIYYSAWVKAKNNTYKDLFIACCNSTVCPRKNMKQWVMILTNQMISRILLSRYRRNTLLYHDKELIVHGSPQYMIADEHDTVETYESSTYQLVPIMLNNFVGFVAARQRTAWDSLLLRTKAPPLLNNVITLGLYTSAIANKNSRTNCNNTYLSEHAKPYSDCLVYLEMTKHYGYVCCCYAAEIPLCQERVMNAIKIGRFKVFGSKLVCAIDNPSYSHANNIGYRGDVYILMNSMEKEFCELHLMSSSGGSHHVFYNGKSTDSRANELYENVSKKYENYFKDWEKTLHNPPMTPDSLSNGYGALSEWKDLIESSINASRSFGCNQINLNQRHNERFRFHCAQLLPLHAQCPFDSPRIDTNSHIKCCCAHRSFCNYNVDIIKRTEEKSIPSLCKYNNEYQYYLHDYFYPAEPNESHTCLLHFASKRVFKDMNQTRNGSILHFLPGSAIQPVDYSYSLLKPGYCDYVDVHINSNYLATRFCLNDTEMLRDFDTTYMPMRLFACRCQTEQNTEPCDEKLEKLIPMNASNTDRKYYCAKYSNVIDISSINDTDKAENDLSPYCITIMEFLYFDGKLDYRFSGDIARRKSIMDAKIDLTVDSYAMKIMSEEISKLCTVVNGEEIVCFCRNDYNNRIPCNSNYENSRALRFFFIHMNRLKTRRLVQNGLASLNWDNKQEWCHNEGMFASIKIDVEAIDVVIENECVSKNSDFHDDEGREVVCVEKLLYEECGMIISSDVNGDSVEENTFCCCINECDSVGQVLSDFETYLDAIIRHDRNETDSDY